MRANLRASEWFESHGDPDRAIHHAVAAEEWDRAARLVVDHTPLEYTNGHFTTIQRWVASLPQDRVLRSPGLCVSATVAALGLGDIRAVRVWLQLGVAAVDAAPGAEPMAELCLLDLRATANIGLARPARDDAARAYQGLPPGIWHAGSCLAYGAWSWMLGEDEAVKVIEEGMDEASVLGAVVLEAYFSAVRSMMAQAEGDAAVSRQLAIRARQVAASHGLDPMPGMTIVSAQHALVAAAGGDADVARLDWQLARSQLALLRDMSGWANVLTRLALAHASLLLGDRLGAETLLGEVRELLVRQPDAVMAREQLAKLEEMAGLLRRRDGSGASALTTAELRVLNYLPTNLTLAEIAERLYVSRYTIKTHCESIYRKLGVRSRSEAVATSRSLGLLEGFSFPDDG
jgi:LuxR family maltose regulon positive regulatory protein